LLQEGIMTVLPGKMRRFAGEVVLALAALILFASGALAACAAVAAAPPLWTPVSFSAASLPPDHVGLTFLGHASFRIESPGGITAVTDYNGYIRPERLPDIVTMNHAHSTHYTDSPDPGIKLVLRGWDPGGGIPDHDVTLGDMHVHNVPTNIRDGGGTEFGGNSIFVFDTGDLCIAHLGHLHHTLTPQHLAQLGPVDVLLTPVDGTWTLSHDDMIEVIESIHPALVIPMHYFSGRSLDVFIAGEAGRYPVRRNETPSIALARAELPKRTEILILPPRSSF
jgi:L-ascorbate metabolism protein UlaG (beta-lactamase superfamily)